MEQNEEYKNAMKIITDEIRKDGKEGGSLYFAWQSNIAVQFMDEMSRAGYKFPDLHKIANTGAKNFLDILIKED